MRQVNNMESNHKTECAEFARLYKEMDIFDHAPKGYYLSNPVGVKADFIFKFCPFCGKVL
jgi:hypothetical protein